MKYDEVKCHIHDKVLSLRNLETLINNINFSYHWSDLNDDEHKEIIKLIDKNDEKSREKITKIIYYSNKEIGELPWSILAFKAKALGISNYSRRTKLDLIQLIERKLDEKEAKSN